MRSEPLRTLRTAIRFLYDKVHAKSVPPPQSFNILTSLGLQHRRGPFNSVSPHYSRIIGLCVRSGGLWFPASSSNHASPEGEMIPCVAASYTAPLWFLPAEHHLSACVQCQRPSRRPSGGWRLRRLWGGSQWWRAHEGGHLPAVLSHSKERGKAALMYKRRQTQS